MMMIDRDSDCFPCTHSSIFDERRRKKKLSGKSWKHKEFLEGQPINPFSLIDLSLSYRDCD